MGIAASCFYKPSNHQSGLSASLQDSRDSFVGAPVNRMGNTIQPPKKQHDWFFSFFTKGKAQAEPAKSITLSIDTAYVDIDMLDISLTDCVINTPKGAQALTYRHFCPICYRHFSQIYMTQCCKQNVCYPCAVSHAHAKMMKMRKDADSVDGELSKGIACPACNLNGCVLVRVSSQLNSRSYVDSPSTIQLMQRSQKNQNKTFFSQLSPKQQIQLTRQYSDPTSYSLINLPIAMESLSLPSPFESPTKSYTGKAFSLTRNQSTPSQLSLIS